MARDERLPDEPDDSERNGDDQSQLIPDTGTGRRPDMPRRRHFDAGFFFVLAVALASGTALWLRDGFGRVWDVLVEDVGLLLDVTPKVIAAVALAAWLRRLMPKEMVARRFGSRSGFGGLLLAVFAGIIIPGGPMTAFPIAIAAARAGADPGTVLAFLSSWLLVGANRTIVWEMAFIDHATVGWRVLLCLPVPILLGLAARAFGTPAVRTEDAPR